MPKSNPTETLKLLTSIQQLLEGQCASLQDLSSAVETVRSVQEDILDEQNRKMDTIERSLGELRLRTDNLIRLSGGSVDGLAGKRKEPRIIIWCDGEDHGVMGKGPRSGASGSDLRRWFQVPEDRVLWHFHDERRGLAKLVVEDGWVEFRNGSQFFTGSAPDLEASTTVREEGE